MMLSNSLVKKASDYFRSGNYEAALSVYKQAALKYGSRAFDLNIEICQRKVDASLGAPKNKFEISKYFDHIYVVNLKHHVEKRLKIAHQLYQRDISFELFDACNGYIGEPYEHYKRYSEIPAGQLRRYPEYNQREIKRGSKFLESAGAFGYLYSYLKILKDAKSKGYKKFLILEDDIILSNDFEYRLFSFMNSVSTDWKIIQLGASQYGWDSVNLNDAEQNGYYYPKSLDTCGSFAIALDCSIVDEMIEAQEAFEAPFDHLPMGEIYERYAGKCYVVYPNIVMPDVGDSSIRGSRCQYTHGAKMKWDVKNFNYPYPKPSVAILISSYANLKYLTSFSKWSDMNLDIRLYIQSEDGVRPVHNRVVVPENYKLDLNSLDFKLPEADFVLTLDEDAVLVEENIVQCIESIMKVRSINETPLRDLNVMKLECVKGRVSVILPTYKRPVHLRNALTSVLDQDYEDIEAIVVSDNGTDSEFNTETRELIHDISMKYPNRNIKLIEHSKNRFGAAARNSGIMNSTGEYICFLDDDDIYLPGRVSVSVSYLKEMSNSIGAIYCGFVGWNSPSNDLERYNTGDLTLEILSLDYKKHYMCTNTVTYKREALLSINGFDESYRRHQDLELNLRFFTKYKIDAVKETLVRLAPERTDVDNKVYGLNILNLKLKFLSEFEFLIEKYDESLVKSIYSKHWAEAAKYCSDKEVVLEGIADDIGNGYLQVYKLLS